MKLNIGCGMGRMEGYINADISPDVGADMVFDASKAWPFDDGVLSEVFACHVLEHISDLNGFMVEAYRCMARGATLRIAVPHPRCDYFIGDPTHVRPIDENVLNLYNKAQCRIWRDDGSANTPFALMLDVDFVVRSATAIPASEWKDMIETDPKRLEWSARHLNNVLIQLEFDLERM